jgi:hypothetical protein
MLGHEPQQRRIHCGALGNGCPRIEICEDFNDVPL